MNKKSKILLFKMQKNKEYIIKQMVFNGALRETVNKLFLKNFDTNFIRKNIKSRHRNKFFF